MPIDPKKMAALKKQYGQKKGKSVYYALETMAKEGKSPKRPKSRSS